MAKHIFTLDFGTSSVKGGLISDSGELRYEGSRVFPRVPDYSHWDTSQWIQSLQALFAEFHRVRRVQSLPMPDAVVVSGNGPTLVVMEKGYRDSRLAQRPVLLWMTAPDSRISGQSSFYLPKIQWIKDHESALYQQAERYISGPEYISWLFSGVESTVTPHDEFTQFIWDDGGIAAYDMQPELFPPMIYAGSHAGSIDSIGSEFSGFPAGIPVIAGGSDFMMSLLGTGAVRPGMTCDRAGTSEGINYCSDRKVESAELRTLPHAVPGLYNVAGILSSTGRMFEWFRTFSHQRDRSYMEMMESINDLPEPTGQPWFFPSLHRGCSWEFQGGMFAGLQPDHDSARLGRGVVNAIGYSIRSALEYLSENGCTVDEMRSCGGQAKNSLWCQMKADLTGTVIEVPAIKDAELTGGAIMGAIGLGIYKDQMEACDAMVHIEGRYDPDPAQVSVYTEGYLAWSESYEYIREAAQHLPHIGEGLK